MDISPEQKDRFDTAARHMGVDVFSAKDTLAGLTPYQRKAKHFDSWSEAYDVCRERGCPMIVEVDGEVNKIYPSGSFSVLYKKIKVEGKPSS